ncbi:MarR family transcriptional regulator [Cryobacterium sp. TMT1-3]|uniref:MarR family transcriptional regulator n=1 Tax=Cryobacterium luteum TaxID=1424661 RepID=A0A1H8CAJ4_9MICO|nr:MULTISPECIES: MarR family transcriptional regulator [Cryobacterium]TFB89289.1 MarR family transcriptional regulator [Cryobacterium luteum]TFC27401.1 MarR family transcriptional regulator [Cryobacterium sp. TMT1-3]SEM91278.1 DNA-binding transcriptional regulator, MarR family [Cryobacterium luteum]
MADQVDRILEQWQAEKPELDVSPMAVIGRLSRTALAVDSRLAVTFARYGLDASVFDVLATLLRSGAPYRVSPAALARDAMISSSAVAQRLNKLQSRGLVSRAANPDDGRGTLVALTEAGRRLIDAALAPHVETERTLIAGLSREEQATLVGLLQRISAAAAHDT